MTICKHCGKTEEEHCFFESVCDVPEGCVCDLESWEGSDISPICDKYIPTNKEDSYCIKCEH